jgi:hypothetical protein
VAGHLWSDSDAEGAASILASIKGTGLPLLHQMAVAEVPAYETIAEEVYASIFAMRAVHPV